MKKLKDIDFLQLGQKMIVGIVMVASVTMAVPALADTGLPTPPCGVFNGLNCTNATGPNDIIVRVINIMLGVAFLVAVLFLIYGGFQYIFSAGNEEKAESGRNTVINALIGVAIIILSYVIVQIVSRTIGSAGSGTTAPY